MNWEYFSSVKVVKIAVIAKCLWLVYFIFGLLIFWNDFVVVRHQLFQHGWSSDTHNYVLSSSCFTPTCLVEEQLFQVLDSVLAGWASTACLHHRAWVLRSVSQRGWGNLSFTVDNCIMWTLFEVLPSLSIFSLWSRPSCGQLPGIPQGGGLC